MGSEMCIRDRFEGPVPLSFLRAGERRVVAAFVLEHLADLADSLRGVSRAERFGNCVIEEFELLVKLVPAGVGNLLEENVGMVGFFPRFGVEFGVFDVGGEPFLVVLVGDVFFERGRFVRGPCEDPTVFGFGLAANLRQVGPGCWSAVPAVVW